MYDMRDDLGVKRRPIAAKYLLLDLAVYTAVLSSTGFILLETSVGFSSSVHIAEITPLDFVYVRNNACTYRIHDTVST